MANLFNRLFGRSATPAPEQTRSPPLPGRQRSPFVAASTDRLTESWFADNQSINDNLRATLDLLRARSRTVSNNNAYARKFLRMVSRNIVGPAGFVLQARVEESATQPDTLANAAIEQAWWAWCKRGSAEVGGRLSFADLCHTVARGVARDGEALVQFIHGTDARNPEQFTLKLIDVARLDTGRNVAAGAGRIKTMMGIELDEHTRPIAYWIKPAPDSASSAAVRVLASDILHIFTADSAEQVRGLPWMHAALTDIRDLGEFNRSALLAARKGADTLGFIVSPDGTAPPGEDEDGSPLSLSAPGTYDVLPEGYDIRTPSSAFPSDSYDPFTKAILRRIASGFNVAYNSLANDLEGVNYSSIRAGVLEERDEWMLLQTWFIEQLLEPVYTAWFNAAIMRGTITSVTGAPLPPSKRDKFFAHEWQGRRWAWVDPLKDIEAARLAIRTGIASPQMVAAQNGVDIEDVMDAIVAFEAMVKAKGVTTITFSDRPTGDKPEVLSGGSALP